MVTVRFTLEANSPTDDMLMDFHSAPIDYYEDVQFRVAPWMMPSHLVAAERLYAVKNGNQNAEFLQDLYIAARAAGISLITHEAEDIWMQDTLEFGQHTSSISHASFRIVNQSPSRRKPALEKFPITLRDRDMGYIRPSCPDHDDNTTCNWAGKLEVLLLQGMMVSSIAMEGFITVRAMTSIR